jgi:hypothetical protein
MPLDRTICWFTLVHEDQTMQKTVDDLTKSLTCAAEAAKQLEMAILHIRSSATINEQSKEEVEVRSRATGFLYAALFTIQQAGRILTLEQDALIEQIPNPAPGPDGKIHKV